jgi:hypothetical protein
MSERKQLGKIKSITFGLGGYQDACIGLCISFGGEGWGVSTFIGGWAIERSDYCKWTEEDRLRDIGKAGMKLVEMLNATRKSEVSQLVNTPVECTFDGNVLRDWRLLSEVL